MKASKILAGLSALSIAASMLSMVASADDDYAAEAPAASDDGASYNIAGEDPDPEGGAVEEAGETTGAADNADFMFNGIKTDWSFNIFNWGGTHANTPYAAYGAFPGWPGWGVRSFATPWKLYEDYLKYKDSAFEVWGIKNDNTVPGYLVFEYDDGNKYVIPLSVDKNGEVSTDEIPVFQRNVNKIYFLFEISDAPQFDIKLNKVNIGGTDIPIVADNMGTGKYASDATPYVLKIKPNGKDGNENNGFRWVLNGDNKKESKAIEPNSIVVTEVDENGNEVLANMQDDTPVFYKATFYDVSQLNNDFDDDFKFDKDKKYDPADNLYDNNHDEPAINHRVWLPTQKMKITFTVSGIGATWIGLNDHGNGDNKGDKHAEVKPITADETDPIRGRLNEKGETTGAMMNLNKGGINPLFKAIDTDGDGRANTSVDLYDSLVEVWTSSPEHNVDAEISFKTVSDKNGVLVANYINVWELDKDHDGNQIYWLKKFDNGIATYVKEYEVVDESKDPGYKEFEYVVVVRNASDTTNPTIMPKNTDGQKTDFSYDYDQNVTVEGSTTGYKTEVRKYAKDGSTVYTRAIKVAKVQGSTGIVYVPVRYTENDDKGHKAGDIMLASKDDKDVLPLSTLILQSENLNATDKSSYPDAVISDADITTVTEKAEKNDPAKKKVWHKLGIRKVIRTDSRGNEIEIGEYYDTGEEVKKEDVEEAYCWHPYFVTENGLVDIVTKNYLGDYKTNQLVYNALTDERIKSIADNNGMYYNDDIHDAAYGHFVVFGDNTEREYKYRIKAEAIGQILNTVQRSIVARDAFVAAHGDRDLYAWNRETDQVQFGPNGELIMGDANNSYRQNHSVAWNKDKESWWDSASGKSGLDNQLGTLEGTDKYNDGRVEVEGGPLHRRATHGAIWLQCCEGTYLKDVTVRAHTDLTLTNEVPKLLYGKENYEAMYPKKPVDSSSAAAGAAAQPTAAAAPADENAPSGAAAGFGIAGLLLAGAAMVCAKKKS